MRSFLLFLHLAGVIIWLGGMFFAHVCLRPAAARLLPPPERLPLLAAVLDRFFGAVWVSLLLILGSGFARLGQAGLAATPWHWHLMAMLGSVMAVIFAVIHRRLFPRLRIGVAVADWPAAAAAMNRIRQLVGLNLGLGGLTLACATLGAGLGG